MREEHVHSLSGRSSSSDEGTGAEWVVMKGRLGEGGVVVSEREGPSTRWREGE